MGATTSAPLLCMLLCLSLSSVCAPATGKQLLPPRGEHLNEGTAYPHSKWLAPHGCPPLSSTAPFRSPPSLLILAPTPSLSYLSLLSSLQYAAGQQVYRLCARCNHQAAQAGDIVSRQYERMLTTVPLSLLPAPSPPPLLRSQTGTMHSLLFEDYTTKH